MQVATEDRLILIDPLTAGPLDAFWQLIVDPARQVIVHAGREEVRLCSLWTGQVPGNLFDLQIAAGLIGLTYPLGHGGLISQVRSASRLPKGETLTEWRTRPLTSTRIRYAFDDVRFLLPLATRLSNRLAALDRLDWAREEFARLAANSAPDDAAEGGLSGGESCGASVRSTAAASRSARTVCLAKRPGTNQSSRPHHLS